MKQKILWRFQQLWKSEEAICSFRLETYIVLPKYTRKAVERLFSDNQISFFDIFLFSSGQFRYQMLTQILNPGLVLCINYSVYGFHPDPSSDGNIPCTFSPRTAASMLWPSTLSGILTPAASRNVGITSRSSTRLSLATPFLPRVCLKGALLGFGSPFYAGIRGFLKA